MNYNCTCGHDVTDHERGLWKCVKCLECLEYIFDSGAEARAYDKLGQTDERDEYDGFLEPPNWQ